MRGSYVRRAHARDKTARTDPTKRPCKPLKVTGARADRRELNPMLGKLAPGDVVRVTRIDRLARSTFDLFAIAKRIADPRRNSDPWRNRGPTPAPAPGA
jgi:DNA invertase Pin-like site-specific DNA recombinase